MGLHVPEIDINKIFESKFLLLCLVLVGFILLLPFSLHTGIGRLALSVLSYLVFITVVYMVRKNRRQLIYFGIIVALAILSDLAHLYFNTLITDILDVSVSTVFYISITILILASILRGKHITLDTIFGAICVYFFLAICYGFIYQLIEQIVPGSFHVADPLSGQMSAAHSTYYLLYFSFTTLSTVGFGDIVPISPYAISVVILEEVTGVLYLAILVARLVTGFRN